MAFRWAALCLAIGAAGCTAEPLTGRWSLDLADDVRARAVVIEARITEGSCAGRELYRAELRLGIEPAPPPLLGPGRYCFSARARDADCVWYASGEATVELPQSEDRPVVTRLSLAEEEPACAAATCSSGVCAEPDPVDGGIAPRDGGVDPVDGGVVIPPPDDAGPSPCGAGCPSGQVCFAGQCRATCRVDLYDPECPSGTRCASGVCMDDCGTDRDCGALVCWPPGICFPDHNCDPGDCPAGLACDVHPQDDFCWLGCTTDADCGGYLRCRTDVSSRGFCSPTCDSDTDCPDGAACLTGFGIAVLPSSCLWTCATTTDCPGGIGGPFTCYSGFCLPD